MGSDARFAERSDRNSPFVVSTASHCFGDLRLKGTAIEDHLLYLREAANTIETQGGFYQLASTSSDSSSDSGY